MADKQFLRLSERWALGYDSLQWIIQRRGSVRKQTGECRWTGESFISSNRDILVLTLREKGIVPDLGKMEEVLALPYTFKEWYAQRQAEETVSEQKQLSDVGARPGDVAEVA